MVWIVTCLKVQTGLRLSDGDRANQMPTKLHNRAYATGPVFHACEGTITKVRVRMRKQPHFPSCAGFVVVNQGFGRKSETDEDSIASALRRHLEPSNNHGIVTTG